MVVQIILIIGSKEKNCMIIAAIFSIIGLLLLLQNFALVAVAGNILMLLLLF